MKHNMKKTRSLLLAVAIGCAWVAAAADAQNTVDQRLQVLITDMQSQAAAAAQNGAPQPDAEELRRYAQQQLRRMDILKNAAITAGLDKQPEVQARWANLQAEFYAAAYAEHLGKQITLTDSEIRDFYQVLARQIKLQYLKFSDANQAEQALELLRKGMDFNALMNKHTAEGNAQEVWLSRQELPAEIGAAVEDMTRGQIKPVRLSNGEFFIFKFADQRNNPDAPAFADVKDMIAEQLRQRKVQEAVMKLLRENGVDTE